MVVLLPPVAHEVTNIRAGEWAHFYPSSFWHGTASYSLKTVPVGGGEGKTVDNVLARVYDSDIYGKCDEYDMDAGVIDVVLNAGARANWSSSLYMTYSSSYTITIEQKQKYPISYLATKDKKTLDEWLLTAKAVDLNKAIDFVDDQKEVSSTVEIDGVDKFLYSQRVYFGAMVKPDSKLITRASIRYYRHLLKVPPANCTNFTAGTAEFAFSHLSLLEISAPSACTDNSTSECVLTVILRPRWVLYLLVVVLPILIACVGLVIGLMAIKALHVKEKLEYMRKKASEEGIALEEGKSKDIHAEKLEEGAEEEHKEEHHEGAEGAGEESHPVEVTVEEAHEDEPKEAGGSAVLTATDGDDQ